MAKKKKKNEFLSSKIPQWKAHIMKKQRKKDQNKHNLQENKIKEQTIEELWYILQKV